MRKFMQLTGVTTLLATGLSMVSLIGSGSVAGAAFGDPVPAGTRVVCTGVASYSTEFSSFDTFSFLQSNATCVSVTGKKFAVTVEGSYPEPTYGLELCAGVWLPGPVPGLGSLPMVVGLGPGSGYWSMTWTGPSELTTLANLVEGLAIGLPSPIMVGQLSAGGGNIGAAVVNWALGTCNSNSNSATGLLTMEFTTPS